MLPEILSIIAVVISGVTAVTSACVPAIINAQNKKRELALKRELEEDRLKREREQEQEAKFELFYQAHLKVVTDFSEYYVKWKNSYSEFAKSELLIYIGKLSTQFRGKVQSALNDFVEKINTFNGSDSLDTDYKNCQRLIFNSFGAILADCFPDILLSDILKTALKEQFYKLQNLKRDPFNQFRFL